MEQTQTFQPIETPIGVLQTQQAFFVHSVDLSQYPSAATLRGSLDVRGATKPIVGDFVEFVVTFHGMKAFLMNPASASFNAQSVSSFDEVVQSSWIAAIHPGEVDGHRHFVMHTADEVIEVIALGYRLKLL